jgi:hypothetical protein
MGTKRGGLSSQAPNLHQIALPAAGFSTVVTVRVR